MAHHLSNSVSRIGLASKCTDAQTAMDNHTTTDPAPQADRQATRRAYVHSSWNGTCGSSGAQLQQLQNLPGGEGLSPILLLWLPHSCWLPSRVARLLHLINTPTKEKVSIGLQSLQSKYLLIGTRVHPGAHPAWAASVRSNNN
jgi:hypothetical protein